MWMYNLTDSFKLAESQIKASFAFIYTVHPDLSLSAITL